MTTTNETHRHPDYDTREILRVNPETGEITERRPMALRKWPREQYMAWEAERRADPKLPEDAKKVGIKWPNVNHFAPKAEPVKPPRKPGSGRPKATFTNPVADYMPLIYSMEFDAESHNSLAKLVPWADDIVKGSIYTSAGTNKASGKVNVKARAVIAALYLSEITAEACMVGGIALRTAQRVAKAARHAAHGLASYLERHPDIKARLDAELAETRLIRGL